MKAEFFHPDKPELYPEPGKDSEWEKREPVSVLEEKHLPPELEI